MPFCFIHLNIEMAGSLLNVGKREIPFRVSDALDLIEPRHRVANMRCIVLLRSACVAAKTARRRDFVGSM
jgi:hypothetical protein